MTDISKAMKDKGLEPRDMMLATKYYLYPADFEGRIKRVSKLRLFIESFMFVLLTVIIGFLVFAIFYETASGNIPLGLLALGLAIYFYKNFYSNIAIYRFFGIWHMRRMYSWLSNNNISKLEWVSNQERILPTMPANVQKSARYWQTNLEKFKPYVGC